MSTSLEKIVSQTARFYLSQHFEDWDPRFFERYDADRIREQLDALDPDVYYVTARSHNGKWFTDLGWGTHRGLKGHDQLRDLTEHFHAKGTPVMAYMSAIYDKELFDLHPDWRQIDIDGRPISGWAESGEDAPLGKVLCLSSPYREFIVHATERLVAETDVDGVLFDMAFYERPFCYCRYCERRFRALTGWDLPREPEAWGDPAYRAFVKFRNDSNDEFMEELVDAVRRVKPEAATSLQYTILEQPQRPGHSIRAGRAADFVYSDLYAMMGGFLQFSVVPRLMLPIANNRPEIGIQTRAGSHDDTPHMKSLDHLRAESFTSIANGGAIMYFDIIWSDGTIQDAMMERIRIVSDEVRARDPWLGGDTLRSVGVFWSESTRLWYGRNRSESRWDDNFYGTCRTLIEEHIPYDVLVELSDQTLDGLDVLVLPNTVCLSDAEADAVRRFVAAGGGLVATSGTSLWDETGARRADFALADVFGAHKVDDTSSYRRVYSRYDADAAIADRIPSDRLVQSWGALQKVTLDGGTAVANIVFPYVEPTPDRPVGILANPPAVDSHWPAVVEHSFGEGRVLYFTSQIDRDYVRVSYPELRMVLSDAVRQVSRRALPLTAKAPMCVELTAFEQPEQNRLVAHLVNYQIESGRNEVNGDFRTRQHVQEIVPVHDVVVTLADGRVPATVTSQPDGVALEFDVADGIVTVRVPRVEAHLMIVFEF